jgi:hypothetical protein
MSETNPQTKLDRTALAAIMPHLELSPEAAAALGGAENPTAAVARLAAAGFLIEAARVCAHALPRREAVWWAARCAEATAPAALPEADQAACTLAETWVRRVSDETRRAAMAKAEAAGFLSPEAWVAVAAFWSGDSMAPVNQPKLPPAPHLTGTAVTGAVILASVRGQPARQPARLRRFLDSARDIASGGVGVIEKETA